MARETIDACASSMALLRKVKLKFHRTHFHARMSACRATSPSSLPRAYLIGRPAVCCGVMLPVCPLSCRSLNLTRPTRARLVAEILVRILARMSRGCYEETGPVEFQPECPVGSQQLHGSLIRALSHRSDLHVVQKPGSVMN